MIRSLRPEARLREDARSRPDRLAESRHRMTLRLRLESASQPRHVSVRRVVERDSREPCDAVPAIERMLRIALVGAGVRRYSTFGILTMLPFAWGSFGSFTTVT